MPFTSRNVIREGLIAGVIGATSIALWFLIVDTIAQRPLFTPALLGRGLQHVFDRGTSTEASFAESVILYTFFHYAVFLVPCIIVSFVVGVEETLSCILGGCFILFLPFCFLANE